MNLTVHCPSCHVELVVPESAGGRRLKCPKCATRFQAPAAPPAKAAPAPHKPAPSPPKTTKVPPSSGAVSTPRRAPDDLPRFSGDLRDLDTLPLLGEPVRTPHRPPSTSPAMADVHALFADDEPPGASRRPAAENRKHARKCPECGTMVPVGMSLCGSCGLDLDTGQRIELVEDLEEAPIPEAPPGPPASILVIGLMSMMAAGTLAVYSFLKLDTLSGTALGLVSLYGVLASILFAAGKSIRMMTIALMLGALVNILTMIVVPVIVANTFDEVVAPEAVDAETIVAKPKPEDPDAIAPIEPAPLAQRIDMTKVTWGIIILLVDGIVLAYINSAPIRKHFDRRHHAPVDFDPLMP